MIFLTAVAFMHLQVFISCLQPALIMALCHPSYRSLCFSLSGRNAKSIYAHISMEPVWECSDPATRPNKLTEIQREIHAPETHAFSAAAIQ